MPASICELTAAETHLRLLRTNALDALMALGADYVTASRAIARVERAVSASCTENLAPTLDGCALSATV